MHFGYHSLEDWLYMLTSPAQPRSIHPQPPLPALHTFPTSFTNSETPFPTSPTWADRVARGLPPNVDPKSLPSPVSIPPLLSSLRPIMPSAMLPPALAARGKFDIHLDSPPAAPSEVEPVRSEPIWEVDDQRAAVLAVADKLDVSNVTVSPDSTPPKSPGRGVLGYAQVVAGNDKKILESEKPKSEDFAKSALTTKKRRRPPRVSRGEMEFQELPHRALRGLVNCGNSCFTNAVLQALVSCKSFRWLMWKCEEMDVGVEDGLVRKFVRLGREMSWWDGKKKTVKMNGKQEIEIGEPLMADWFFDIFPGSGVVENGGGRGGSQEDAEEFLSFVLNGLHEEFVELEKQANRWVEKSSAQNGGLHVNGGMHGKGNGVWNGWRDDNDGGVWEEMTRKGKTVEVRGGSFAESGITDIFGGVLRNEVKRGRAKGSVTKEPFFTLSLDIENGMIRDVEDALKNYFEPEQLEEVEARKLVALEQLPKILVLRLKRFSHNTVTGALTKVNRVMPFGERLEIPLNAGCGRGKTYELIGVVTHLGKDLAAGHYTCDVKIDDEMGWYSCDDSKVHKVHVSRVMRKQAYLLFYSLV